MRFSLKDKFILKLVYSFAREKRSSFIWSEACCGIGFWAARNRIRIMISA